MNLLSTSATFYIVYFTFCIHIKFPPNLACTFHALRLFMCLYCVLCCIFGLCMFKFYVCQCVGFPVINAHTHTYTPPSPVDCLGCLQSQMFGNMCRTAATCGLHINFGMLRSFSQICFDLFSWHLAKNKQHSIRAAAH